MLRPEEIAMLPASEQHVHWRQMHIQNLLLTIAVSCIGVIVIVNVVLAI